MIVDTTYLLPLSRIGIDTDLLLAIDRNEIKLDIADITISLISIFELQAKAAKLKVSTNFTNDAIDTISTTFRIRPFYDPEIVETSYALLPKLNDYIGCIIVATAAVSNEDLITEDTVINDNRDYIKKKFGVNVIKYRELLQSAKYQ